MVPIVSPVHVGALCCVYCICMPHVHLCSNFSYRNVCLSHPIKRRLYRHCSAFVADALTLPLCVSSPDGYLTALDLFADTCSAADVVSVSSLADALLLRPCWLFHGVCFATKVALVSSLVDALSSLLLEVLTVCENSKQTSSIVIYVCV